MKQFITGITCFGRTTLGQFLYLHTSGKVLSTTWPSYRRVRLIMPILAALFNHFFAFKISFSEYLLSFCMANNKECPMPKQVNEVLTQQISYARRKMKRARGKLASIELSLNNTIQDHHWRWKFSDDSSHHL